MKKLTLLLIIIFAWLQYSLWLGKNGVYDYLYVKKQESIQKIYNIKLRKNNEKIFSEINDINNHIEAIEEHARNDLGMIKKGETYYRVIVID